MNALDPAVAARLKSAAGLGGWSEDPGKIAPHLTEWRHRWRGITSLLLQPSSTTQVAEILSICNSTRTPVVPQGGNTGLVGGQIPTEGEVLLSLERMNRIRSVSPDQNLLVAEAGVNLAALKEDHGIGRIEALGGAEIGQGLEIVAAQTMGVAAVEKGGDGFVAVPDAIRGAQPPIATPITAVPLVFRKSRRCIELTVAFA